TWQVCAGLRQPGIRQAVATLAAALATAGRDRRERYERRQGAIRSARCAGWRVAGATAPAAGRRREAEVVAAPAAGRRREAEVVGAPAAGRRREAEVVGAPAVRRRREAEVV